MDSTSKQYSKIKDRYKSVIMKSPNVISLGVSKKGIIATVKDIDNNIPDYIEGVPIIQKRSKEISSF